MDEAETREGLKSEETEGVSSSLELGKVRQVLSLKMEKPDTHYTDIAPLGKGSFGEVHSAHDSLLGRDVAIKSLKSQFRDDQEVVDRFLKEARGTAQLEHPNIMPVHEVSMADDLGVYFTMKKIHGEDLKEILDRLEANTSFYQKKYSLEVLLEIFLSVCNGVAFAHSKDVIHRDLKPANIMIGEYGEVLILDWGLVKKLDTKEEPQSGAQLRMDESDVGTHTLDGAISGTPNYMSPEQAEGKIDEVAFQSDVYSLGSILYHILTHRSPFEKTQLRKLLENVRLGRFEAPRKRRPELKIPRELEAICLKAMSRFQINRYRSVERLAEDIRNFIAFREVSAYKAPRHVRFWRTCRRNPIKSSVAVAALVAWGLTFGGQRAMLYGSYQANLVIAESLRTEADELVVQAKAVYDELQQVCASTQLREQTPRETELKETLAQFRGDIETKYNVALAYYDGVPELYRSKADVRDGARDIWVNRIEFALYRQRYDLAERWLNTVELMIDRWGGMVPLEVATYLAEVDQQIKGYGSLDVQGGGNIYEAIVLQYDEFPDTARFSQGDAIGRGKEFPLKMASVKSGSYLVWVTLSNGSFIPYPVFIGHGENTQVVLEIPDGIPEGMAFVPGGRFVYGGEDSRFYREHERELSPFFIKKYEVTVAEYLEFWENLTDIRLRDAYMSRIRFDQKDRWYNDAWNEQGELLDERLNLEFPVVGITTDAANAFCVWKSAKVGAIVRLPTAAEWEKTARGVDGRKYVWGNGFDPALTLTKYNEKGKKKYPLWAPPGKFPFDVSVYNVYDMGGNVREMTSSLMPSSTELFQLKGGSAFTPENFIPCSNSSDTPVVPSDVGFRYVQELP